MIKHDTGTFHYYNSGSNSWEPETCGMQAYGYLTHEYKKGTPPEQNALQNSMEVLKQQYPKEYIKGHLLNEHLGGRGTEDNLFPITRSANSRHSHDFEEPVKGVYLGAMQALGKVPGDDYTQELLDGSRKPRFQAFVAKRYGEAVRELFASQSFPRRWWQNAGEIEEAAGKLDAQMHVSTLKRQAARMSPNEKLSSTGLLDMLYTDSTVRSEMAQEVLPILFRVQIEPMATVPATDEPDCMMLCFYRIPALDEARVMSIPSILGEKSVTTEHRHELDKAAMLDSYISSETYLGDWMEIFLLQRQGAAFSHRDIGNGMYEIIRPVKRDLFDKAQKAGTYNYPQAMVNEFSLTLSKLVALFNAMKDTKVEEGVAVVDYLIDRAGGDSELALNAEYVGNFLSGGK